MSLYPPPRELTTSIWSSMPGDMYFTDQGQSGLHQPEGRVFRYSAGGRLECLIDNAPSPNGIVLNKDESILYVAMTRGNAIWRLPLMDDGGVSKVGLFVQLSGGMAVKTLMHAMGSPNRSKERAPALPRLGILGVKLETTRLCASSGNGAESFCTGSTLKRH